MAQEIFENLIYFNNYDSSDISKTGWLFNGNYSTSYFNQGENKLRKYKVGNEEKYLTYIEKNESITYAFKTNPRW